MHERYLETYANELLRELMARFPVGYRPRLEWRQLRVTAGVAYYRDRRIVLSRQLLCDEERLRVTLTHEYAHLLAVARHGLRAAGHGRAWRAAMLDLGLCPETRHSYEVRRNLCRQEVTYRCSRCGTALLRHRRLARKRRWVHARCGGSLRLESVRALAETTPAVLQPANVMP